MKKIFYIFIFLVLASCNDVLDIEPLDKFSEVSIWSDPELVEVVVNNTYLAIEGYATGGFGPSSATDQLFEQFWYWTCTNYLVQGTMTPENADRMGGLHWWWGGPTGGRWTKFYGHIRETNVFFSKIDELEGDEEFINRMKGEMYFLRAYSYAQLIDWYGGVPIVDELFGLDNTEFLETRDTYQDCIDYIVEQLDMAIALLPESYDSEDIGRATKGAAMALKARQLLHAASPLYNGATFANEYTDGQWNTQRLESAKTATKAVLDMDMYQLYDPEEYRQIFVDKNNSEVIFGRYFNGSVTIEHQNRFGKENGPSSIGGWGGYNPLQQFVDAFEMADGSKFDWDNPEHAASPYENREERFYQCIYYDGAMYKDHEIELFFKGIDSPESPINAWNASETAYLPRKNNDESFDWTAGNQNQNDMWIIYRLSEFYLNYAEILCELGETSEALNWLNPIRERVGLPEVTTTDQNELRERIRHERNIELCFEGQRYHDIRRWGIFKEILSQDALGAHIIKAEDGTKTYSTKVSQKRTYDPKSWFLSIPRDELQKNLNLENNPGYN